MKLFFAPKDWKFGDFDLIEKNNDLQCIFIKRAKTESARKSEHGNSYGLASSKDGLHWTYEGEIKTTNPAPAWDAGSLWAMCVFRYEDKFAMLYSATKTEEPDQHQFQQIGLSFSTDLRTWTDHEHNPIITNDATGEFYHPKEFNKFAWRDPTVYKIDNTFNCIFAAKDKSIDYKDSACVAHFTSEDLISWTAQQPLFTPGNIWELETPHIYEIDNKHFIIFGIYPFDKPEDGVMMKYASAGKFLGPYTEPENNSIAPTMCFAERIISFKNQLLLYHWIRDKHQGKLQTYLAPPKLVERHGNHLLLKKHPELNSIFPLSGDTDIIEAVRSAPENRIRFKKSINKDSFNIILRCKDDMYSKDVTFTRMSDGISIKDQGINKIVHDDRTVPIILDQEFQIELFFEDRFLEVYVNNYFVYAVIMEKKMENIDKLELT